MAEAQRGESKRTGCITNRECAAADSAERSRMMWMEEWPLPLEKLKSCWTEQRGLKPESRRGQKKRRPLPGWIRLPVTYSKAAWRQDGEAKSDDQNPLSCPPLCQGASVRTRAPN